MEEIERPRAMTVSFVLTVACLVLLTAGLAWIHHETMRQASLAVESDQKLALTRLSLISLAMILLTAGFLAVVVARRVGTRLRQGRQLGQTPYEDAWGEAGRRFKLPKEDEQKESDGRPQE